MVSVSVVDRYIVGTVLIKDNIIGICCYSAKHLTIRRKSKDFRIMCSSGETYVLADRCFSELIYYKANIIIISLKCNSP